MTPRIDEAVQLLVLERDRIQQAIEILTTRDGDTVAATMTVQYEGEPVAKRHGKRRGRPPGSKNNRSNKDKSKAVGSA
jgi:hypothetical protein